MVSVLAVYSYDPSSNPAKAYIFSVQFVFEKNKNKQKEAEVGTFKNHLIGIRTVGASVPGIPNDHHVRLRQYFKLLVKQISSQVT